MRQAVLGGRRGAGVMAAAVAGALLLAACSSGEADEGSVAAADVVHVHGLGVSQEGVYVATHHGLYEVVGDSVRAVSDAGHDLMGFTVAGPGDLLASGHPDLRVEELQVEDKPPLLGLVHSTDGHTWESLSLLGEADFHSLEAAHGRVYGFDGTTGRFMVSDDRRTWVTRAEQLSIVDFAVSPVDADLVVATVEGGIGRSRDGGRSWEQASSEQLVFVDWGSRGVYGITADGQLAVSEDDGNTWDALGTVSGQPEALLAADDAIYAAVAGKGIVRSTDGGRTFEMVVDPGA